MTVAKEPLRGSVGGGWSGRRLSVVIIGAGIGGICMAIQLKNSGVDSFVLLEKADDIGGIWRDNTYPGCGCDIPSHLYSFSFDPYRSATLRYPTQPQILSYLHDIVDKYDLRPSVRTNAEVTSAHYDESTGRWKVTVRGGDEYIADAVVYAVGQLHRPRWPDIPGRDQFSGPSFHSARWDHGSSLDGKDVAVVGTGSSAAQLIPHVARSARQLHVFQRTANWVLPKPGSEFKALSRLLFRIVPGAQTAYRKAWRLIGDSVLWPVITGGWSAPIVRAIASVHRRRQVANPELRRRLIPDHPIGCKRMVIDSGYFPALNRANVDLVTESIERVTSTGVVTSDGRERRVDAIVYATGFRTTEFLVPMDVRGVDGRSLHDGWRDGAEAYLGVAVPGFPSLFLLHGPNTILGHNSNIFIIECQVGYVLECLRTLARRPSGGLDVQESAMAEYRAFLAREIGRTSWQAGCRSWYRTEAGRVTNPWPGSTRRYARMLRQPRPGAFRAVPATGEHREPTVTT